MKHLILTVLTVVFFSAPALAQNDEPTSEHEEHAGHAPAGVPELRLDDGQPWATDEPLRTGMADIRAAFDARHEAYQRGDLGTEDAAALADTVEDRVNFMIANCSLPPDADAELHKLLAAAFGAAAALRTQDDSRSGLHQLHGVLKVYGESFDHPGWDARER